MAVAVGVMLSICALEDAFTGKIHVWYPAVCMVFGVCIYIMEDSLTPSEFWLGALVGLIVMALAAISGGRLGNGDGLIAAACGMCLGWEMLLVLLFGSMALFLAVGVVGILWMKWNGKRKLPFVPFMWAAYMVICLFGGV